MTTLFLVKGNVVRRIYQGNMTEGEEVRLVEAEDEFQAASKFEKHFESKSIEYSVTYSVWDVFAYEVIT